jgi:pimeloyl-ACP methyl ester carboxylesterase
LSTKSSASGNQEHDEQEEKHALRVFAWGSLLATHHPDFLAKNEKRVSKWVELVAAGNTRAGLLALLDQTHTGIANENNGSRDAAADVDKVVAEAAANCRAENVEGLLMYGAEDRLLDASSVPDLARAAGFTSVPFDGLAHAVPLEAPALWRKELLGFLDR